VVVGSACNLCTALPEVPVGLLKAWGGVLYYETSVREEINVAEVFEDVIRQMVKVGVGREDDGRKRRRRKCIVV
jgi:hypothetical protein